MNPGHRREARRILLHTSEPATGAARYVSELAASLAARRNVKVFCPANFDLLDAMRAAGVEADCAVAKPPHERSPVRRVWRNLRYAASSALRQMRQTRRGDIVHIQFPQHFPLGLAPFLLARATGAKVVFTAHDPVPRKWLLPGRRAGIERFWIESAYALSHRIIVHHSSGAAFLRKEFDVDAAKISVVSHGYFHVADSAVPFPKFDALKLLCFGSIRENKGLHLAIEAVQRLNRGYGRRVRLTIAGDVPSREHGYWERCKRLIQAQPEGIWVIDRYIAEREAVPLIAEHHAMLLAYQASWSESSAACLALSNGRPILATQSGGLAALLAESGGGFAIEDQSAGSIARAIQSAFLAGHEQLEQMGAKGKQFLQSRHSWDAIARQTEAVYDDMRELKRERLPRLADAARGGS